MAKHIVLLGKPGAGKGTFSAQIKEVFPEIVHISTGDIFRENLKNETSLGLKAKEYMEKGELVPDSITNSMVKDRLTESKDKSWILDGYPRNIEQAKFLSDITSIDKVILLSVDDSIIIKRILGRYTCDNCGAIFNKYFMKPEKEGICDECGAEIEFKQRSDDNEETLQKRLDVYKENVDPIIEYYKEKEIFEEIDYETVLSEDQIKEILG
ncbi:MAG: adenylate kinase [Candidatus Lokiarchaeota archaeon]|nr:adenylate kinase [Candidatus Lokiarchaeota archaeon]MBD3343374.1 adenylate kinase [Candidatus Lokiarchaeota archaeon]